MGLVSPHAAHSVGSALTGQHVTNTHSSLLHRTQGPQVLLLAETEAEWDDRGARLSQAEMGGGKREERGKSERREQRESSSLYSVGFLGQ